ncbi:MAG: delta-aminolevulinic acid dehydratase [Chloroflexi bacterium 13_1_40CM_4_68_4]|nr:MAG: delta-aminolevulinic acid dehydratase [Chloroflexi bacterium 13_1_40CM_4_68_4]
MTFAPDRTRVRGRRFHRLRRTPALRGLVRETRLAPDMLVLPVFVDANASVTTPIASLPGHDRVPVAEVGCVAERALASGVRALLLFGLPEDKDDEGRAAAEPLGPVPQALRRIRASYPELALIADVCLCEYTTHGHCGIVRSDGTIDNDSTLPRLSEAARVYAEAGADVVAPSDMMDGRIAAIREALDDAGLAETAILSYAAKFASAFYGPFRDAADCAPRFGDRSAYQMDPANGHEALAELQADLDEGADALMVKPAGPYLDVLRAARDRFDVPLAAYQVSGEYAALHAAAANGWLDLRRAALESLTGIARAGADIVITYFATEVAAWLRE